MSKVRILAGQRFNLFERGAVVVSPAADALYPASNLYDGDPGNAFRFGSSTSNPYVQVDADLLQGDGLFETFAGGAFSGWTEANTGTGDVTQELAIVHSGTSAAKLTAGTGTVSQFHDVASRAGELLQLTVALRGDGGAGAAKIRIFDPATGKYLTSAGAWQATPVDVASRITASYAVTTLVFQVDSFLARGLQDLATLRVTTYCDTAGVAYVDSLTLLPGVDWASIHGHNIDPLNIINLSSDATGAFPAGGTLRAQIAVAQPSLYGLLGSLIYDRFWRIQIGGIQSAATGPAYMGEVVLGQSDTLARSHDFPLRVEYVTPQARSRAASRRQFIYAWGTMLRIVTLPFQYRDAAKAQSREARDEIVRRTAGGLYPMVIVPQDDDPDLVVFGRGDGSWLVSQTFLNVREAELVIEEDPFPTFVG